MNRSDLLHWLKNHYRLVKREHKGQKVELARKDGEISINVNGKPYRVFRLEADERQWTMRVVK